MLNDPERALDGATVSNGGLAGMLDAVVDDRYELLEVIGSGGMATVWRARDTRLGRLVALKRPHPAPPGSAQLARFVREARAAATVSHPHLVAVFDAGEDDDGAYLVMELIDGPSLAGTEVSPDRAAEIGVPIASALAALHAAGIVHGDVKPGNILLADDGAKLTDFGIALTRDDTTRLTQAGMALGTPAYAPPEARSTGDRTSAGDVYSLAAVLHELVTGSSPNDVSAQTRVMPPGFWAASLASALATDPAARPSAAKFAASLSSAVDEEGETPTVPMTVPAPAVAHPAAPAPALPPSGRRTSRTAIAALLVGAIAIVILLALALRDDGDELVTGVPAATQSTATETSAPSTSAPSTSAPPTSAPPSSAPPTSAPPATAPPDQPPAAALSVELTALIESVTPFQIKPKETRDVVKRIDDALAAAAGGDEGEVEQKLVEAAERLDRHLSGENTREQAVQLLIGLARELGVEIDVND